MPMALASNEVILSLTGWTGMSTKVPMKVISNHKVPFKDNTT